MPDTIKTFNGDITSKQLLESLTEGLDFSIPNVDLNDSSYAIPPELIQEWLNNTPKVSIEDLTSRQPRGSGVFDALMESMKNHLQEEFKAGRITGAEYTNAYIQLSQACLSNAVQFLLGKDQAYWGAVQAQVGAITSNVNLATAKVQLVIAQGQALTTKANYANTVLSLAENDAKFGLTKEQYEAIRAQTLDTRSDGEVIVGSVGKQKDLYTQQIDSYVKDAKLKASKIWSDSWIAQKSLDDALQAPTSLQNETVDQVLATIKTINEL